MRGESRRWLVVGALAAAACTVPALAVAHGLPIAGRAWRPGQRPPVRAGLYRDLACWWLLFSLAAYALLRAPRRSAVVVAVLAGLGVAVASLAPVAVLSNDLYRYAWDGRVQAAGVDPYRYPPVDAHLARLRDGWLWPGHQVCASYGQPDGCTRINRSTVRTIYPPLAQLWFRLAHAVLPAGSRDRGWELLGLAVAALTVAVVLAFLVRSGRDPRWIVLWTLCPVVPLEAVQNAHVDAVAALAVAVAAALALARPVAAGVAVAAAGLTKLYPLVLMPAVVQRRRWLVWPLVAVLVVVAYLPYLLDVGTGVGGYLSGYLHEEGYGSGSRFFLLRLVGLSGTPAKVVAYLGVALTVLLAVLRRLGPPVQAATTLFVVLLLVATPGEPWYELVLVVLLTLTARWEWLGIVVADYVGYLTNALGGGHHVRDTCVAYGLALALGVVVAARRRRMQR